MLGLKRGTVTLVPHHPQWAKLFEREKERLQRALGGRVIAIEHIGSTAVPGLAAKPILDIAVGISSTRQFPRLTRALAGLGYQQVKNKNAPHVHRVFAKGPTSRRTHYLHLLKYRGAIWNHDLQFRDYLRQHPDRTRQYAALKRTLAATYANDRAAYTQGKKHFIQETSGQ